MDIGVGEGQELRESEKRRSNLEKFAKLRSRQPQTQLELKDTQTAFVAVDDVNEKEHFKNIVIPTKEFEQKITSLNQDYFDFLMQKGFTIHEVGHILYSSWPALEKYQEKVKDMEDDKVAEIRSQMFGHLCNIFEDGAIERFLADEYRVGEEILCMRSTLHEGNYSGRHRKQGNKDVYIYPSFFAVAAASINKAIYDNGETDMLLNENNEQFFMAGDTELGWFKEDILPAIEDTAELVVEEPDAEKRIEHVFDLWQEVSDFLDKSTMPGDTEAKHMNSEQENESYGPGIPSNMGEGHGDQQQEPSSAGGSIVIVDDGDEEAGSQGEQMKQEAEKVKEEQEAEKEIEEKGEEGVVQESKQEGAGDWSDEIEEFISIMQQKGGDGYDELVIAESEEVDSERQNKAKKGGRRAGKYFARNLRQLRKEKVKRGKRRGEFDPRRMIAASRGDTRVFQRTEKADEYDYSCMIVDDRSGSISGDIEEVEEATGSITYGLEKVGVDTCVMDICNSYPRLVKPFGTKTQNFADRLFTGATGGGTPLRYTIRFARERMDQGHGKYPFMIIICDGAPNSKEQYMEEIKNCSFPVLGLYITNGYSHGDDHIEEQMKCFDKGIVSGKDDDIQQQLINLINKIVF